MKTDYIMTHRWNVKISGVSGIPKIVCLVGQDWQGRLTHRERMDGFVVAGPFDHPPHDNNRVLIADHIVKVHNASLPTGPARAYVEVGHPDCGGIETVRHPGAPMRDRPEFIAFTNDATNSQSDA